MDKGNEKNSWDKLSLREKAQYFQQAIAQGITDRKEIIARVNARLKDAVQDSINSVKSLGRKIVDSEARNAESYSAKNNTFADAYKDARSKGQKTFFWDGKYYNTDYEGEHGRQYRRDVESGKAAAWEKAYPDFTNPELRKEKQEELDTYGITNEQTQNKSFLHKRALKNLDFYGDYDWKQAVDALVLNHDQRAESDTSPENLTHYQQLRFYLGYPLIEQDAGRARSGLNGYGAPVKISAFRPTTGTNSTPYYYTFLRNPYGNRGLTAGPVRDKYERLIKASEDYLNGEFYKDAEKHGLDYAVRVADENTKRWDDYFDNHLDELADLEKLENFIPATYRGKFETKDYGNASGLGNFTQYGTPEYRSFYDLWDIGLGQGNNTLTFGLGKPFEYYDRRYHDDETKQNIANPDIDSLYSDFTYANGGHLYWPGGGLKEKLIQTKNKVKDIAKKVGKRVIYDAASAVSSNGGVRNILDLGKVGAKMIKNKIQNRGDYDDLKLYMYGPESLSNDKFIPFTGNSYGDALQDVKAKGAKEYYSIMNPDNEFVFPEDKKYLFDVAANANSNIYVNADNYAYSSKAPRYDAGSLGIKLRYDDNGNMLGSAFDVYDFDDSYAKRYSVPLWQVKMMQKLGTPYIVRQENIPIRFVKSNSKEAERAKQNWEAIKIAEAKESYNDAWEIDAKNNIFKRAGYGLIPAAKITTEAPYWVDKATIEEL